MWCQIRVLAASCGRRAIHAARELIIDPTASGRAVDQWRIRRSPDVREVVAERRHSCAMRTAPSDPACAIRPTSTQSREYDMPVARMAIQNVAFRKNAMAPKSPTRRVFHFSPLFGKMTANIHRDQHATPNQRLPRREFRREDAACAARPCRGGGGSGKSAIMSRRSRQAFGVRALSLRVNAP